MCAHVCDITPLPPQLNVSKNSLNELPEFLFCLPNLSSLDLSHNNLQRLPFALWKTSKLHTFNCSHNSIEKIPTNWPRVLEECTVISTSPPPDQQSPPVGSPQVRCSVPQVQHRVLQVHARSPRVQCRVGTVYGPYGYSAWWVQCRVPMGTVHGPTGTAEGSLRYKTN